MIQAKKRKELLQTIMAARMSGSSAKRSTLTRPPTGATPEGKCSSSDRMNSLGIVEVYWHIIKY